MGKIVMPKNSALLNEVEAVLKIYYEAGSWLSNDEYKSKLRVMIGDDQYESSYTKKAQITSYFGFTEWEDISNVRSLRRITKRGKDFYEHLLAGNQSAIQEDLMASLENTTFGRNNFGCTDSDSDVEPPVVFVRASVELGYLTYKEFAYMLWKLEDSGGNYTDIKREILSLRSSNSFVLPNEAQKYTDAKPIMVLLRWGFLQESNQESVSSEKHIVVNPEVLQRFKKRISNLKIYNIDKTLVEAEVEDEKNSISIKQSGENILLYGVPGCGKSHTIKTKYCNDETYMERIVFHPDYTNSDFLGQILPVNNGGIISYEFSPGPFTRILHKAYMEPDKMFYLVIEEINRGNAPAIFGEVFQLLDRENGVSEYGISNPDMARAIYVSEENKDNKEAVEAASRISIKIPGNLMILATMNTADQNVFTLDTAFKRRWKMESIPNSFDKCELKDIPVGGTNLKWKDFAETINYLIVDANLSSVSSEDKRLGAYFAAEEELKSRKLFAEKILAYLWDDVFKYDRSTLFNSEIKTLEELVHEFSESGLNVFSPIVQTTFNTIIQDG